MTTPPSPESRPDRRTVLKGAVAAGVGAAAWVAPDISTLGFTPAYAQTCSLPTVVGSLASPNVACLDPFNACGPNIRLGGSVRLNHPDGGLSNSRLSLNGPPRCADGSNSFAPLFVNNADNGPVDLQCEILTVELDGPAGPQTIAVTNGVPAAIPDPSEEALCPTSWAVTARCCVIA